jgi:hypothetical protein
MKNTSHRTAAASAFELPDSHLDWDGSPGLRQLWVQLRLCTAVQRQVVYSLHLTLHCAYLMPWTMHTDGELQFGKPMLVCDCFLRVGFV